MELPHLIREIQRRVLGVVVLTPHLQRSRPLAARTRLVRHNHLAGRLPRHFDRTVPPHQHEHPRRHVRINKPRRRISVTLVDLPHPPQLVVRLRSQRPSTIQRQTDTRNNVPFRRGISNHPTPVVRMVLVPVSVKRPPLRRRIRQRLLAPVVTVPTVNETLTVLQLTRQTVYEGCRLRFCQRHRQPFYAVYAHSWSVWPSPEATASAAA